MNFKEFVEERRKGAEGPTTKKTAAQHYNGGAQDDQKKGNRADTDFEDKTEVEATAPVKRRPGRPHIHPATPSRQRLTKERPQVAAKPVDATAEILVTVQVLTKQLHKSQQKSKEWRDKIAGWEDRIRAKLEVGRETQTRILKEEIISFMEEAKALREVISLNFEYRTLKEEVTNLR